MEKDYLKLKESIFTSEFRTYFKEKMRKQINSIKKYQKLCVISLSVYFLLIFLLIILKLTTNIEGIQIAFYMFCRLLPVFLMLPYVIYKYFREEIKMMFLPELLSFLGNVSMCNGRKKASLEKYVSSLKIMPSFSEFYCDDYFKIKYNNDIDIFISELSLSIRTGKSKMQVFKGILMTLPFGQLQNEYFELLIVNNGQIRLGEKRVYLEDPEFEKYFDVYSNDQIEARNIITPAFMTRLLKLQNKKLYNKIKISIEKGNINIAFPSDEDWFEIPLFKNPEKISNFRNIIMELISIISIVDSLKLIK